MEQGIIQIYTGDGKGKTTAAIGLAARAWGRGLKVKIFQFLKAPGSSGEHWTFMALNPPLGIYPFGIGDFIVNRPPTSSEIQQAVQGWNQVHSSIQSGNLDLVIIDELSHALNLGLLELETVLTTLKQKPPKLEIVLTGTNMPTGILEIAGLITEMKMIKHPHQQGLAAREGIEY